MMGVKEDVVITTIVATTIEVVIVYAILFSIIVDAPIRDGALG